MKDAAGNISAQASASVTITLPVSGGTVPALGIKIPATGQIASYADGDDGSLLKGVAAPATRFTQGGLWTVNDSLTGLSWVQPGNLMVLRDQTFDADGTVGDGFVTWQHALDYVKKLNSQNFLGYSDWRLPDVTELASLYDYSKANPATSDIFTNLSAISYWSSTSYSGSQDNAWYVNLQNPYVSFAGKSTQYAVLPVRGGTVITGTVTDTTAPTIQTFTLPTTWDSLTVPVQIFNVVDLQGVTGYYLSENPTAPAVVASGWRTWVAYPYFPEYLINYTFSNAGQHTLYAWVKDAAGNVSAQASSAVTITLPTTGGTVPVLDIKIPATGQTISYADGDDGSLLKGVAAPATRFTQGGLWTVNDSLTGLSWVQPGNLMVLRDPTFDADGTVGDGFVTWQHALDYVKKLNSESFLGHSDWRLPDVTELASLYDYSKSNPATSSIFTNLGTNYWSSTSYSGSQDNAWYANLQNPYVSFTGKSTQYEVMPVRGGRVGTVASLRIVVNEGSGSGTVASTPNGIDCGSSCGMLFDHTGDAFSLTAVADSGSAFTGWGGACSGAGTCSVTLNGEVGVTAFFNKLRTVTINKSGSGDAVLSTAPAGLNCGTTCSAQFPDTVPVTITAQLPITSVVASWSGCDSSTDTQCTFTIPKNGADRQIGVFLSSKSATTLSMSLSSSAILNNGSVIASGKLTRLPDNGSDLSGQTVTVTITPPTGTSQQTFTVTTTTDATGHYSTAPIAGFTQKGAYTIQASTPSTSVMIAATSPSSTLMVGAQAGYAIIVQGEYPTLEGLAEHEKTTNRVYNTLKSRGFSDDTILYLSYQDVATAKTAGITVDGIPSRAAVQNAITSWAKEKMTSVPAQLWLIMVDHGTNGNFYLNKETIAPADLDTWLTTLETATATTEKRIIIDGSCYSGSFIPLLAKPGRIVISSAAATEESYRGPLEPDGIRSGEYFLDNLFSQLNKGLSLKSSFDIASQNTHALTIKGNANSVGSYGDTAVQHPLIDDMVSSNGSAYTSDSGDGALSATIYLGTGSTITNAGDPADITSVTPTIILTSAAKDQQLWLSTYGSAANVDTAWVEVRSPDFTLTSAGGKATMQLVVDLPKLPMTYNSASNRWKAVTSPYTGTIFTGFTTPGTYELFYYTRDLNGTIYTKRGVVYRQSYGNSSPDPFDLVAPTDGSAQKTTLLLSWNGATDPDNDLLTYTVQISRDNTFAKVDYVLEGLTDPVAAIGPEAALLDLTTYYWQVIAIDQYGAVQTSSQVWSFKTDNTNGLPGIIKGTLRSDTGTPIAGGTVSVGSQNFTTLSNGAFIFIMTTGSYNLTAIANGYQKKTLSIIATAGAIHDGSMALTLAGGAVNGTCGSDSGKTLSATPVNFCSDGTVSGLTGTGPWSWNCAGSGGGTTANCSATKTGVTKPGDCDSSGTVTIAEVQTAINMFLGLKSVLSCVDQDTSGTVSIAEVQKVINAFLGL